MVGIVDIYGTAERVEIRPGVHLEFIGWSARAFGTLLRRFPFIMDTFNAKPLTLETLAEADPMAVGAVLAGGVRNPETGKTGLGVPELEEVLADLPLHLQLECGKAIQKCTFPKGLVPFLLEWAQILGVPIRILPETPSSPEEYSTQGNGSAMPNSSVGLEPDTATSDMKSPRPPFDSVPTTSPTSGTTPPAK